MPLPMPPLKLLPQMVLWMCTPAGSSCVNTSPAGPRPNSPFKVGDEVYGRTNFYRSGCAAEYAIGRTEELALKAKNLSWVEAATVPLSALTAWQAIFVQAGIGDFSTEVYRGKRILITAASGGVGMWVVRLAGAEVVGTCGPCNVDFVRSLGATEVIDYTKTDLKE